MLLYYKHVDPLFARCALQPLPEVQHACSLWLEKYFATYGDWDPTTDIQRISVLLKQEVWTKYQQVVSDIVLTCCRYII